MIYEYKVLSLNTNPHHTQHLLNGLAKNRWRLVAVTPNGLAFLEREKLGKP